MAENREIALENAYTDLTSDIAFGGESGIVRKFKDTLSRDEVNGWLRKKDYYTVYKKAKKTFPRRPTVVWGVGVTLQADLLDMKSYASKNDGYKYILTCVDVLSRFAWAFPLKSKTGREVAKALEDIFSRKNFSYLHTDKGKEFFNAEVERITKHHRISHYTTEDDRTKATIVERFNQTLGSTLHRFMMYRREKRYVDVLETVVETYNRSPHGRDKLIPSKAHLLNGEDLWLNRYERRGPTIFQKPLLSSGNHVRVAIGRKAFTRGYDERWTREVFVINKVLSRNHPVVYTIKDLLGENIKGTYYQEELQLIDFDPEAEFEIEKVIATRKRRGKTEKLVKWLGYPEKFNQWISVDNIV